MIEIKTLTLGPMSNNTYIVCGQDNNCFFVDPSWNLSKIDEAVVKGGLKPAFAILTHGHFDHSKNITDILSKYNIPVYVHKEDAFMLADVQKDLIKPIDENTELSLTGNKIKIIHTPGHTPGGICIQIENNLFTGDTLFVGQCGRVDLPHSNPAVMRETLIMLSKLDPALKIFPGHMDRTSTIGEEAQNNPYIKLAKKNKLDFIEAMS